MKIEFSKKILPLLPMATLFLLNACSPPNDATESKHAGVLTETESGHTIAFSIEAEADFATVSLDKSARKSGTVQFALTKIVDGKTELMDSATVEYGDYAVFEDANGAYSVVATAIGLNGEKDTLFGADILKWNDVDTVYVRVQEPASVRISTSYTEIVKTYLGEELQNVLPESASVCITGTLACKKISAEDIERGYAIVENIPLFDNESSVSQIEIQLGNEFRTLGVDWHLSAGDTLYASDKIVADKKDFDISFTLPESDMYDTIGGRFLDSMIVPIKLSDQVYYSEYSNFFLDEHDNVVASQKYTPLDNDSAIRWFVIPRIDSSATLTLFNGTNKASTYSRLSSHWSEAYEDTLTYWTRLFDDSSFAISFWLELDSLADSTFLLANRDSSLGFEIRRCQKDSTAICTRIYNGIDSASTDSVEYGKASIIDGKRHHYSLVIHKKHLTIAVDGVTIRDTDLKLSEKFYYISGLRAAPGLTHEILLYSFGDFIRYPGDRNWTRLKAWLYAFYEFQKDI